MNDVHIPVLVEEICFWLNPLPGGVYVDCTVGIGGTSLKILEKTGKNAHIIGLDRDYQAIALAKKTLSEYESSVNILHGNFSHIRDFVQESGYEKVDGVVFDLGVSSLQLDQAERGFSFSLSGPLDMRMDQTQKVTAADLVNHLPEKELADVIFTYGEERYSRRIARAIVQARGAGLILTTQALVSVLEGALPFAYKKGRLHFATRTFQALRIRVNRELDLLEPALRDAIDLLKDGGRVCVVAFHSLEDRIVKQTFRSLAQREHPKVALLVKKPVNPSVSEIQQNTRARSAKLRVAERLPEGETL
ncbi:16S rRNA (cytosine(1402)-N(4))-methyltransferase RsmH [Candidatus Nitrospira allomarina]|uniref:Ribosomal RNA small subunit methyltransferase H n=1 Tax=Candidatus Nitrospira allomarina TaxID=3020900 RepID=A0AA96GC86_9BACT|nr:16S rRNA (cytosine(1402)-N(4))-methyltransferase RsmH [Candidatus Nitrospira allomarina]WNM59394.1 16S rRNA (cytosine(1402)-N(4))-methyltransferase RsmH [Candidatus Nitrospira allomarina]